jgi:hypothetical protein
VQDAALQANLDQMGSLLLGNGLRTSEEDCEERTLAQARTLTVLERLDPARKTALLQFLVEAKLVQRVEGRAPIITLNGANLSDADLRGANLFEANLSDTHLSDAKLSWANLRGADLNGADLRYVDLSDVNLTGTDRSFAYMSEADLSRAEGVGKELLKQQITSPYGAIIPDRMVFFGEFEPAVSFKVGEGGNSAEEAKAPDFLVIYGPKGGELFFTNPLHVFDPSNPSEQETSRARKHRRVGIVIPETPEPRHFQAGLGEHGRCIRQANRRDGHFYTGELPQGGLRRTALRSSLHSQRRAQDNRL